ncbi:hypothetical protein FT663_00780 [Candidozyma haemuli var. vulneris]|uniref:DUF1479 domain protein n=1 Tax=Candidozyma haemuli TaxID=45357 RepID=A0A2V1AVX3_9ASCO|nr:hypothetical protein CXQ85_005287 [[Candida] haemuloni]KAF3992870.1 hypothetical protein FT662_00872 [[Candida] haemuloni var. vulneris]KAF3995081.1 hypothetical protein FT663_00780 [[Candida] haemuloni var. vulneris]PVH22260.1 hypothetical protein CXQ85_005287 [[Candida] haemuloni]
MPSATTQIRHFDLSKATVRPEGDISTAFNSFGKGETYDNSFWADIKKSLIKDPVAFKESWLRLKDAYAKGLEEIKEKGSDVIPSVTLDELSDMDKTKKDEILKRGCVVIRGVIPEDEAAGYKDEVLEYAEKNPTTKGFPQHAKVVYELYWSKPQVKARAHPNLRKATRFMNGLFYADPDAKVLLDQNVSYADRLRIRQPGDALFSLGPHADGGSLERWEDEAFRACYTPIFEGRWEDYDPNDATHRIDVNMDKYASNGTCNIFRAYQGWLAVSKVAPKEGSILFGPLVKEATAYWMMSPFFDEDDNLLLDSSLPGTFPGKSQEFNNETHPGLRLDDLMVPVPAVRPGDMVFWHCDLIHAVDSVHQGTQDSSVFYIPSAPLCNINVKYAAVQRESFLKGLAGPDFPGFPNVVAETKHVGRATPEDVEATGGIEALQELGLAPFSADNLTPGQAAIVKDANDLLFE